MYHFHIVSLTFSTNNLVDKNTKLIVFHSADMLNTFTYEK